MARIKNTIMADGKRKVCRIFDMGSDGVFDRYTIAFKVSSKRKRLNWA